jgi:V/A-type H+-transporting ATPase subunit I
LDNPWPLRGFQSLVTNYGHPSYGELDPTVLLALTFPLVFGVMFGDVGQGLLLTLVGLLFASRRVRSLRKFAEIGVVLAACGVAATIFGFLYGSVFGFEDLLQPLWIRPLEQITDVLLVAVAMGGGILSLGMVTNMVNAALESRWGHFIFGHHGLAGLLFYWSALGVAISLVSSAPLLPVTVLIVVMALSGVALTFGELFQRLVEGEETLIEEGIGTYLMQAFFELFEVVIGLLSNTLSYVRMGAFAVAHGALSLVVFILAELVSPTRGLGYWLVVVLGNLFIIGFEGMIVGIQTLRLEYYEFFSKFFSGTGVVFHPLALIPQGEK